MGLRGSLNGNTSPINRSNNRSNSRLLCIYFDTRESIIHVEEYCNGNNCHGTFQNELNINMVKLAFLGNESSRSEVEYYCTRCNFTQLLRGFRTKENHTSISTWKYANTLSMEQVK